MFIAYGILRCDGGYYWVQKYMFFSLEKLVLTETTVWMKTSRKREPFLFDIFNGGTFSFANVMHATYQIWDVEKLSVVGSNLDDVLILIDSLPDNSQISSKCMFR